MKRLFIFCDGTANTLTPRGDETNVLRLFRCLQGFKQAHEAVLPEVGNWHLFYDPGVGAVGLETGRATGAFGLWSQQTREQAFGDGVYDNVADAYSFLMRHWEPGCRIYLFGFSRGAFTARAVAGMVHLFGVLRPDADNMLPSLLDIYFSSNALGTAEEQRSNLARQIVEHFSQQPRSRADPRQAVWVDYVGVWDTVESVGWPMFRRRISSNPTFWDKRFVAVRHAVALHEHRRMFKQRLYGGLDRASCAKPAELPPSSPCQRSIQQRWFPGGHCDVGGCETEWRHANATLRWVANGLFLNGPWPAGLRQAVRAMCSTPGKPPYRLFHDELHARPAWALLGMVVRNDMPRLIPRSRHMQSCHATVWNQLRFGYMVLALLAVMVTMGIYARAMGYSPANVADLAILQLMAVCLPADLLAFMRVPSNRTATWLDFLNIASLTGLMLLTSTRAFQRLSLWQQNRPSERRLLQWLGWLPLAYMLSDSTENLLSLAYGTTDWSGAECWVWLPMLALSMAALVKWVSVMGATALLAVWMGDIWVRHRKPATTPP